MAKTTLIILLPCFLLVASLLPTIHAVKYIVTNNVPNTPGGIFFNQQIGVNFTIQTMGAANQFIWKVFKENTPAERKVVPVINVYISEFPGPALAYTNGDNINISAPSLKDFCMPLSKAKYKFTGLMYHEMTHLFQWSGNRTAPGGLTEGTADYVMVKSNFNYDKNTYTQPGSGSKWDEGYGVTERFLEYCDSLKLGFTADLNKMMRYAYSDDYFMKLLGKPLNQLWKEYKAKYGNKP
ncbi:hypothetical protein ABFS83_14G105400 [Erythranthe nasuta]